jgi:serine protease Do
MKEIPVTLAELPRQGGQPEEGQERGDRGGALQGVSVQELTPQIARRLGLGEDAAGVVVSDIDPASPAAGAGLRRGDIIQHVNRVPVKTAADFAREVRRSGRGAILLLVSRGGVNTFVAIEPGGNR